MATRVMMKNPTTGLTKKGYVGFSWTYLFFGGLVPLFRGEISTGALHLVLSILTAGISNLIFCFLYNKQFMHRLIEAGYRFADQPATNEYAAQKIGADLGMLTAIAG